MNLIPIALDSIMETPLEDPCFGEFDRDFRSGPDGDDVFPSSPCTPQEGMANMLGVPAAVQYLISQDQAEALGLEGDGEDYFLVSANNQEFAHTVEDRIGAAGVLVREHDREIVGGLSFQDMWQLSDV